MDLLSIFAFDGCWSADSRAELPERSPGEKGWLSARVRIETAFSDMLIDTRASILVVEQSLLEAIGQVQRPDATIAIPGGSAGGTTNRDLADFPPAMLRYAMSRSTVTTPRIRPDRRREVRRVPARTSRSRSRTPATIAPRKQRAAGALLV
jgi:hypothetical protein